MALDRRAGLCVLAMATLCLGLAAAARGANGAGDATETSAVPKLLDDLKRTEPYERSSKLDRILKQVEKDPELIPTLMKDVAAHRSEPDISYTALCIMALGQLEATAATYVLTDVLESRSALCRYAAAVALGDIWQEADESSTDLPRVNAALMAAMCAARYAGEPAGLYGPGLALGRINGIGEDPSKRVSAVEASGALQKLSPGDLRKVISLWAARHPQLLPELEDQPWELQLDQVVISRTSAQGRKAKGLLVRNKPLGAVETVTSYLRRDEEEVPEELWRELGAVLTGITGVAFPGENPTAARNVQVDLWLEQWTDGLKGHKEEPYRRYAFRAFEKLIQELRTYPGPQTAEYVELFKNALLFMLDSPADIPVDASRGAKSLLEVPLSLKRDFQEEIAALNEADTFPAKQQHIAAMKEALDEPVSLLVGTQWVLDREAMALKKEVANQFVGALAAFARKERNVEVLKPLSRLMASISGVPCRLTQSTDEDRNRAIDKWLESLQ